MGQREPDCGSLACTAVFDLSPDAVLVLRSLRERPTLNTATLIREGAVVEQSIDDAGVNAALAELEGDGLVKHRPTGWKAVPQN